MLLYILIRNQSLVLMVDAVYKAIIIVPVMNIAHSHIYDILAIKVSVNTSGGFWKNVFRGCRIFRGVGAL